MSSVLNWLVDGSDSDQHNVLLALIRITLILLIAWLFHSVSRQSNPRLKILLWRTAAIAIIILLGLFQTRTRLTLPILPGAANSAVAMDPSPADRNENSATGVDDLLTVTMTHQSDVAPGVETLRDQSLTQMNERHSPVETMWPSGVTEQNITVAGDQSFSTEPSRQHLSAFGWAVAAWAVGVALISSSWLAGTFRLVSLYRRASAVSTEVQAQASAIASAIGYACPIDLRHSAEISTPCIVGAWRPRVLIPTRQCERGRRQELRASLAHELTHCKENDLRWNHLLSLLQALLWFHPLVWRVRVAHADACDELCDANAAEYLGDGKLYGRLLAALALRVAGDDTIRGLAMARLSQVRKRIEAVGRNIRRKPLNRWQTSGIISSATLAVVLLGIVGIGRSLAEAPLSDGAISGTGEPGATVRLYLYSDWNGKPELKHETTVESNGRFTIQDVPTVSEEGRLVLAATKPGFASVIRHLIKPQQGEVKLAMTSKTGSLSGRITDLNGSPISSAVVSTQLNIYPVPGVHTAKTDENGRYSITDLALWNAEDTRTFNPSTGTGTMVTSCSFSVIHRDYPLTRGSYSQVPQIIDITLLPPAIVEGQVVDLVSGEPLADVDVQAQGIARHGWFTTTTNTEGNYRLRMTNDHYNIWAVAPNRIPLAIKALKVTQGRRLTGMDIRMTRGGFVVGKVINPATNQSVDGSQTDIRVAHYGPARPKTGAAVTSTKVKADGTYRLHVAPGRNYVYLMSGDTAPVRLNVGDGQTVHHDFVIGLMSSSDNAEDPDELLARAIREEEARREDQKQAAPETNPDAATQRGDTTVGQILTELEDMNTGPDRFRDAWANQLRKIVAVGPAAVPELIKELDRTSSDMMLRSLGFIIRAIGDKRAVPGLIRSIPKTLHRSGSDMGLRVDGTDETLIRFMQLHDLDSTNEENEYAFGRPVREVFGALHSLTGQNFGEQELYSVFLDENDFSSQKHAKALLFHRVAERWAQWWQQNGHKFTDDPSFREVNLPPLPDASTTVSISADTQLKTDSGTSNWILESIRRDSSGRNFYDLDTGRAASLPNRWRDDKLSDNKLHEILDWAANEGYDIMGDEIEQENKNAIFVLRSIRLRSWELPKTRWKADLKNASIASLQEEGRINERDLLLHVDAETNDVKPSDTATFFYLTREGTPGILYVGIEVHDNSLKPGGVSTGDAELNPVAFHKGRRFGLSRLVEAD